MFSGRLVLFPRLFCGLVVGLFERGVKSKKLYGKASWNVRGVLKPPPEGSCIPTFWIVEAVPAVLGRRSEGAINFLKRKVSRNKMEEGALLTTHLGCLTDDAVNGTHIVFAQLRAVLFSLQGDICIFKYWVHLIGIGCVLFWYSR